MSGIAATKDLSLTCSLNTPALFTLDQPVVFQFLVFFTMICASSHLVSQKLGFNKQSENFLNGHCDQGLLGSYSLVSSQSVWTAVTKYLRLGILYVTKKIFLTVLVAFQNQRSAWSGQSPLLHCRLFVVS